MTTRPDTMTLMQLRERYDVFFIDQFGVLRDGERAYDGAPEALAKLKASGAVIVILSNSGRSGDYNAVRLERLGFSRDSFDHFVTSGDVAASLARSGELPVAVGPQTRCLTISSGGDRNLADRLGWRSVERADEADLVVISGSETETVSMDRYRELLRPAAERGVLCICTNPDHEKLSGGALLPSAGAIADLFEALGGRVERVGKPYLPIYRYAHNLVGAPDPTSIICVGDSPEHDIQGARGFGVDSALTLTGIFAGHAELRAVSILANKGQLPTYLVDRFA